MTVDGKGKGSGRGPGTKGQTGRSTKDSTGQGPKTAEQEKPTAKGPEAAKATSPDVAALARATRPSTQGAEPANTKAPPEPTKPAASVKPPTKTREPAKGGDSVKPPSTPAAPAEPAKPAAKAPQPVKAPGPLKPSTTPPAPAEPAKPAAKTTEPAKPVAKSPEPARAEPPAPKLQNPTPRPAPAPLKLADASEIEAIIRAEHRDPFAFLGAHVAAEQNAVLIRTFQPGARSVALIDAVSGSVIAELRRLHDDGFFAEALPGQSTSPAYRFRVQWDEQSLIVDDAYRFPPVLSNEDIQLLAAGEHLRCYRVLGSHPTTIDGVAGVTFAVWAPHAHRVAVIGDFNAWDGRRHAMRLRHDCGVWEMFVPGAEVGQYYKYEIKAAAGGEPFARPDPVAFQAERWPGTAAVASRLDSHAWSDDTWMKGRQARQGAQAPVSIYEVHLGSWRRIPEEDSRALTFDELAEQLPNYVASLGFTHVQFMPVFEHHPDTSWGYDPTALYAPTGRYGGPDGFRRLVDRLHRAGIGVLLDWVPTGFSSAPGGLGRFDGQPLYEPADERRERHIRTQQYIYDYGRKQVVNYLLANALFWLEEYHVDGLRIGGLTPILYLDYDRAPDRSPTNRHGGNENLEAVDFLRRLNEVVYGECPETMTIADEHVSWQMVSRPTILGGLGFGFKANDTWLHQALTFLERRPIHRKYYHDDIIQVAARLFEENALLAIGHDFLAPSENSLIARMPGSHWDKFANLRQFFALMWTQPGKKLLFMGAEFAQWRAWNHEISLDWHLMEDGFHRGVHNLIRDLNQLYTSTPALYEQDSEQEGFAWIDCHDSEQSVVSWLRLAKKKDEAPVAVVCNFTPVVRHDYRIGVPVGGIWDEALNTDSERYGGSNVGNAGAVLASEEGMHGRRYSLGLRLPPYAAVVLRHRGKE